MLRALILLAVATFALTSCGTPGAPLPPSLHLPEPPADLVAVRKGDRVTLTWTMPRETTDGASLRQSHLGPTKVCRGLTFPLSTCARVASGGPVQTGIQVGELSPTQTPIPRQERGAPKLTFTDTITPELERGHETDFATYAVQILNSRGKAAGMSKEVKVPLAPTAPPPAVRAEVTADAVRITVSWLINWHAAEPNTLALEMRVQRRAADSATWNAVAEQGGAIEGGPRENTPASDVWLDRSFQWEHTYYYKVTPITRVMKDGKVVAEVEGDDSPEVAVFTKDVFPPAQPSGVQAVFSGTGQKPFIDLTWAPNTEEDLAGYNVYRREVRGQGSAGSGAANQSAERLNNTLVASPSFRDDNVQPGHTYFYSVSAVDLRNNESQRSEETSESVPK